jgi:cobalt transporter subunit CbtA
MITRMVTSAVCAGIAAGLLAALLHFAFVQKYILLGEDYESGASVHYAGLATQDHSAHDHETPTSAEGLPEATEPTAGHDHAAHDHSPSDTANPVIRNLLTVGFTTLLYTAYALILVAGFALARQFGQTVTARDGLIWGIGAFVAVQLAPAMGLSPELPGTTAAPLADRQLWWAFTAVSSALALAIIAYGRKMLWVGLGVALLAAPHLIGAPELEGYTGVAPPEVAAAFAARSLGAGLAVWAVLGWLAGWFWNRNPD